MANKKAAHSLYHIIIIPYHKSKVWEGILMNMNRCLSGLAVHNTRFVSTPNEKGEFFQRTLPGNVNFRCIKLHDLRFILVKTVVTAVFCFSTLYSLCNDYLTTTKAKKNPALVYNLSWCPNKYIIDWWLELIIDVKAKIEFVLKVEWWQSLQINQTHIKWPGERQKIKGIDVYKSLVTLYPAIQIKHFRRRVLWVENGNYNNEMAPFLY